MKRFLVLIAALGLGAGAVPAAATLSHFTSPSGNIDCMMDSDQGGWAQCMVQRAAWPVEPRKPASCDLDWSATEAAVTRRGVSLGACRGDIGPMCVAGQIDRCNVLAYGRSVTRGDVRCTSLTTGMLCRKRYGKGIGFKVSRQGYIRYR